MLYKALTRIGLANISLRILRAFIQFISPFKRTNSPVRLNNPSRGRTPKLYMDISSLVSHDHQGGIQRVQKSIAVILSAENKSFFEFCAVAYSTRDKVFYQVDVTYSSDSLVSFTPVPTIVTFESGDIYFNSDLNYEFTLTNESFFNRLKQNQIHIITLVYDLLPLQLPESFPVGIPQLHSQWLEVACRYGPTICISETVAQDVRVFGLEHGVAVEAYSFPLGSNFVIQSKNQRQHLVQKDNDRELLFIVVGTVEPRKGHQQIYEAFEFLWKKSINVNLTFIGKKGWKIDAFADRMEREMQSNPRFNWHQDLDDFKLQRAYSESDALINASFGEGFGLPIVEASFFHLPLILRDIPIFHEIAGGGPWYFRASSGLELANSLERWIDKYRNGQITYSQALKTITWEQSVSELVTTITKIVNRNT